METFQPTTEQSTTAHTNGAEIVPFQTPSPENYYPQTKHSSQKTQDTVVLARTTLNYALIAVTFLVVGLAMGWYLFTTDPTPTATIDEDTIRAIVQDAIANSDLGAVDDSNERFELVDDDPYLGEVDAPVVIVEFGDFRCPYCGVHHTQTLIPLLENYGQYIRYVYRDFPGLGQESINAALAAQCANEQGFFWQFHDELFAADLDNINRNLYFNLAVRYNLDLDAFVECYDSEAYLGEVNIDYFDGQLNSVQGTPSFFINGHFIRGAQAYEIFERAILRELDKAGIILDTESAPESTDTQPVPESSMPDEEESESHST